ncbi:uncharacterized protein LOC130754757 [Actinidia eriantha]|uniref:uncharacterized protein LOC130754757 n=1 Tax=Actinidia eriantha TaxID=165200 RepID=UPI00258A019D|nr:uncharacterized protein LOC130754757 [Actinidia eriantha]
MQREAVSPTSLRNALSALNPESNFFQEVQIKDASEVLVKILECFNRSFTAGSGVSITKSSGSKGAGYCRNDVCIAHNLFGMDIRQKMSCDKCGFASKHTK